MRHNTTSYHHLLRTHEHHISFSCYSSLQLSYAHGWNLTSSLCKCPMSITTVNFFVWFVNMALALFFPFNFDFIKAIFYVFIIRVRTSKANFKIKKCLNQTLDFMVPFYSRHMEIVNILIYGLALNLAHLLRKRTCKLLKCNKAYQAWRAC